MVKVSNYERRVTKEGKEFFVLQLQGGIEMVRSQESGKFYVTAKKATFSSTFDEETCQALIGQELPGSIGKIQCEPYDYTIKDTGEVITITHRFEYIEEKAISNRPMKSKQTIDEFMENINVVDALNTFSSNGQLTH